MMGRREDGQGQFFYSFDLDKVVPPDHLVRQIDGLLDLSWVHKELAPYYSHTGSPIIPSSPVRGMNVSGRATLCVGSLRVSWQCALRPGWLGAKRSRSMRA
jgi:hypothetical protein